MMDHKGKADTAEINTEEYDAGDCIQIEVGDWNGSGFSYKMNGNSKRDYFVVEACENQMVVVRADDRCNWSMTGDESLEMTISTDGMVENFPTTVFKTPRVKAVLEEYDGRSGYHKVAQGIEKTRNK